MPNTVFISAESNDPGSRLKSVIDNLKFLFLIIVPIVASIVLVPILINPFTIEEFKTNFKIVLLSKPFCEFKPEECSKLLDPNYGNSNLLKRTTFSTYDLVYIRHYSIEIIDNFILKILNYSIFRKLFLWVRKSSSIPFDNETEFLLKWHESLQVIIAIFNSMVYHTIKGILVSKMWVFFAFGTLITISESWSSLLLPLYNVLRNDSTIF